MARWLTAIGAGLALLGVGAGAFGAHALEGVIPESRLATWELAARHQLVHGVAAFATGLAMRAGVDLGGVGRAGAWLLVGGVVVFSGTLYGLAASGVGELGAITPIGGTGLVVGWAMLAWGGLRGGVGRGPGGGRG